LTIAENGRSKKVVFSGDLGPHGLAFVRDAVPFRQVDLVFLESTYGDRDHKPPKETLAEFRDIIQEAVGHRARILVPAFAVGRTQQILFHLEELFCAGTIKPFPIYLDSPMAAEGWWWRYAARKALINLPAFRCAAWMSRLRIASPTWIRANKVPRPDRSYSRAAWPSNSRMQRARPWFSMSGNERPVRAQCPTPQRVRAKSSCGLVVEFQ